VCQPAKCKIEDLPAKACKGRFHLTAEETQIQNNEDLSTDTDSFSLVQWRREQVLRLRAKGFTYDKIVDTLKAGNPEVAISHGTIANDLKSIKDEVNANLARWVTEELPTLNRIALVGISEIIKSAWELADSTRDERTKISALQLVKEGYVTQREFLSDSRILNKTLRWLEWAKGQLEAKTKGGKLYE
jgi:hypothetical protein